MSGSWYGQVCEFTVWSELLAQSRGRLHIFLPLADRGVDGIVHNPLTHEFTLVQVKGRATLAKGGEIDLHVPPEELAVSNAVIVLLHGDDPAFVIPMSKFR